MLRASRASAVGDRRRAHDDRAVAPARTARRRRRWRLPTRRSSARRHARRSTSTARSRPVESTPGGRTAPSSASSACCLMISREHAPPTNPSMRPSANTIARSPRCADTGARRATTVATANDCPSRRSAATCSKKSIAFMLPVPSISGPTAARAAAPPASSAARAGPPAAPETRPRRAAPPCTSRPHSFSNRPFNSANVSSSRHSASFASRSR